MTTETYLPAVSKYIDSGKLDDSENDRAACNQSQKLYHRQNVKLFYYYKINYCDTLHILSQNGTKR